MDTYDYALITGTLVSAFFTFAPHAWHLAISPPGLELPHQVHVAFGITVGLITLYFANRKYHWLS